MVRQATAWQAHHERQFQEIPSTLYQLHIRTQSVNAPFASIAALFISAKRGGRVEFVVGISPNYTRAKFLRDFENLGSLIGPDRRGESVGAVVSLLHRLFRCAERKDGKNGSKNFFLRNPVGLTHTGKKGRGKPISLFGELTARLKHFTTFVLSRLYQFTNSFQLVFGIDGTHIGIFVEWITDTQCLEAVFQFANDLIMDPLLYKETGTGATDMSLIIIDAIDNSLDGLIDRCIFKNNVGRFSTELHGQSFSGAGGGLNNPFSNRSGASEGNFPNVRMTNNHISRFTRSSNNIDDPRRKSRLFNNFCKM